MAQFKFGNLNGLLLNLVSVSALVLSGCGGGGSSSSTPVTVPIANDDVVNVSENSSVSGSVASNDIRSDDGGNVWQLVDDVTNGKLELQTDGAFVYRPNTNFFGRDSFTYTIQDSDGDSSELATVTISVNSKDIVADPFIIHQWYLENIGQRALTTNGSGGIAGADVNLPGAGGSGYAQGFTGAGVQIAVIDNDMQIAHEDLLPNVLADASYNFFYQDKSDDIPSNGKGLHDPTAPNTDKTPNPDGYHGTAVAGLAAARGGNGVGLWGVAPNASLIGYNLLYSAFNLTDELAALGYENAAKSYFELGSGEIDVFNMSYGRNPYQGTNENASYSSEILAGLEWGTQNLRDGKGAVYVKAGGNEYYGGNSRFLKIDDSWCDQAKEYGITCYNVNMENENVTPYQMIIGAFNAEDKHSSYSNTGSALWLVGPGGEFGVNSPALMTTDFAGCNYGYSQNRSSSYPFNIAPYNSDFNTGKSGSDNENCNYFSAFNGSSSATPVVSGIAALLLEANPNLTWREVKHILATTARQLDPGLADNVKPFGEKAVILEKGWIINKAEGEDGPYHFSNRYGFGAPDGEAAITMAKEWKASNKTLPAFKETAAINGSLPTVREIPNFNANGLTTNVVVDDELIAESVELIVSIDDLAGVRTNSSDNKIDMSDYQIVLRSPKGTENVLLTPFNAYESGHDMLNLKLISHAFYGEAVKGEWTLIIRDLDQDNENRKLWFDEDGDNRVDFGETTKDPINDVGEGKLTKWSLKIYGH
ncbi:MAG: S8 family serine peptidase [Thiotrichales bacterium]|nr:S8 family serine peptidase [Thiotrichales bacterium]